MNIPFLITLKNIWNMPDRQFNYKELEEARGIAYSVIEQVSAIKVIKSNNVNNME